MKIIKLSSYQGREDGSSMEADERGCQRGFVVVLTFPQMAEAMLHKLVVVLHQVASGYGR